MKQLKYLAARGFSLIELALALTILLIIIPSMLPVYESFVKDIEEQALKQRILEVRRAMQVFYMEHGRYPHQIYDQFSNDVDFIVDKRSELVNGIHNGRDSYPANRRTYITKLPKDPMTGRVDWLLIPMDNDLDGVFNEDPIEVTTGTYLGNYDVMPARMYRGMTTGTVAPNDGFIRNDDDRDGRVDEDPIDVGDIRSRAPGFENL